MGHPVVGQFEFRDAGKMERKNGDVALRPHFSEVPKTKNRDTGLRPHFSSGPKFKMTHYRVEPGSPILQDIRQV